MMKKITVLTAALAAVGVASFTPAAQAFVADAGCQGGGHYLTAKYTLTQDATYHYWDKVEYRLTGASTGGKSDVKFRLVEGGSVTKFEWPSPDNRINDKWYTKQIDVTSTRAKDEKFRARAGFDTAGQDNECIAVLDY